MLGDPYPDYDPIARRRAGASRRPRRVTVHHARRRPSGSARIVLRLGVALLALLLIGVVGGLVALDRTYSGRILANVWVQGRDLSQMRPDEARAALRQRYAAFLATPITFQFADRTWRPTPEQLGVYLEIDTVVTRAYAVGRGANVFRSVPEALAIWQNGVDLPLHLTVDQQRLQAYLTGLAHEVEVAPRNAQASILKGRAISTPARTGRQMLVDDTTHDVLTAIQTLQPQTVMLRTGLLPPLVDDTGIAQAQQQLSALLRAPVVLTAGERRWTWAPEELGDMVRLSRVPRDDRQGQRLIATLDRAMLLRRLQDLAREIDTAPIEPRLRFTTNGPQITQRGHDGARLEIAAALDQLTAAFWQEPRVVALPVTVLQPQARPDTLVSLGIVELVAQGKSSFENSAPYRVQNIQAGAQQMQGVLIAPDATFSFNQTVGAIDETNGFTQGYAIIDGRTQQEWGGGVCQVSTTVFRAAFWAGLPITERNQHTFRIRWYEKFEPIGMDAAIFTGPGGYDLRFVNDTGYWLLLETVVDTDNEVLTVNLYGAKPDREVIETPPVITNELPAPTEPRYVNDPKLPAGTIKQTDTARGGMDVRVGRIVKQNDTVVYTDTFFSRFQPWPNIFVRGTGQ